MKYKIYNGVEVDIDEDDLEKVSKIKWHLAGNSKDLIPYGRIVFNNKKIRISLGRYVLNAIESPLYVDHINRNRYDNRKSNLRLVTASQNMMNRVFKNETQGVQWHKRTQKWIPRISINGKYKSLGSCLTREEALTKRLEAVKQYYGEFAPIN